MSIFYEESEIGGNYDQDKEDFTNPNNENNDSGDQLYDEFNKLGDSYIKIKEYTSIFHDLVTEEYIMLEVKGDAESENKASKAAYNVLSSHDKRYRKPAKRLISNYKTKDGRKN